MVNFRCGVERVKRFVNVDLHCIVTNLKTISKMSTLPPPRGKISADAHVPHNHHKNACVYQLHCSRSANRLNFAELRLAV